MKKSLWMVLLLTAGLVVIPVVALAALGVHATTGGTEGACAECHNTAQTAATRGWGRSFTNVPTTGWYTQPITSLCWTCHSSGNTVGAHDVTTSAFQNTNHSYVISNAPPGALNYNIHDNATMIASNLPYTGSPNLFIQCTSCHNVHNDAWRPFNMRPTIRAMCVACHPGRNTTAIRALNIGESPGGTNDNVSVHPVGIAQADQTGNLSARMIAAGSIDLRLRNQGTAAPAANGWTLGGKLESFSSGNISCETCHAVHNVNSGTSTNDLLAINNEAGSAGVVNNPLCAGCHYGGFATLYVGAYGGPSGTIVPTDHPLDNAIGRAFYPTGVALPTEWTAPSVRIDRPAAAFTTVPGTNPGGPRCSSCHDIHGGLGTKSLLRRPIPSAASNQWCFACHSASQVVPNLHHSNKTTLASSVIKCADCHGGSNAAQTEWTAHNGFGAFLTGPDSNSSTPAADGTGFGLGQGTTPNSQTFEHLCETCHVPDNPTTFKSVTGAAWTPATAAAALPSRHGITTGTQTHLASGYTIGGGAVYIQDTNRTFNSYLRVAANPWGVVAANAGGYTGQNIYSKYGNYGSGAATPINPSPIVNGAYMICESCHNLLYNAGAPSGATDLTAGYGLNLVLLDYKDDGQGTGANFSAANANVGDGFCRGCHSTTIGVAADLAGAVPTLSVAASYVHYPEAHTSSNPTAAPYRYATTPYGRTTNTILAPTTWDNSICPDASTADAPGPGLFSYPAANRVNCDSCHRPHNADANGNNGQTFVAANAATVAQYVLEDGTVATNNQAKTEACVQCHRDRATSNWRCLGN